MSTKSVLPFFEVYTDAAGQPLDNGKIYIGTSGLDAVANQIAVYFDECLTIPEPQPIRTSGGYPVNSGTPTEIFTGVDYSMSVQ